MRLPFIEESDMHRIFLALFTAFIAVALPVQDAEAKRFGGGRSSGMQRDAMPQKPATPQRGADNPAPTQNGAAAAPGKRSWLGPVAGLAAGLGLAALASHLGLGEEFANVLMLALLVLGGLFLFRLLIRRRQESPSPMRYAGQGIGGGVSQFPAPGAASPASFNPTPDAGSTLPPGFDAEAFVRQAKLNFIRLQAASDAGNLDDIREFTTPEMYAEIALQFSERGDAAQHTEVTELDAEVLEAVEESNRHRVSVRFHGGIREEANVPAQAFNEVWHLVRPAKGGGWVVAGIQQM
jgi:predicted lipid-binding transport protein (Tim44 family)